MCKSLVNFILQIFHKLDEDDSPPPSPQTIFGSKRVFFEGVCDNGNGEFGGERFNTNDERKFSSLIVESKVKISLLNLICSLSLGLAWMREYFHQEIANKISWQF